MVSAERGQLILVGAIAMALIVIGLVLVINTALFTQVVGSEGTVEGTKSAGVTAEEIEDSAGQVVHSENVEPAVLDPNDVEDAVHDDTSDRTLDALLLNGSLGGSGAYLDVTYEGSTESGTAVLQPTNGDMSSSSGDWDPVPVADEVGHFTMVIVPDQSSGTLTVDVDGTGPANQSELRIDASASGSVVLEDGSGTDLCGGPIGETDGTVRIDVRHGYVMENGCTFDTFDSVEPDYTVSFTNPDAVHGQYRLVTGADSTGSAPCTDSAIDCYSAVWQFELSYTYESVETTLGTSGAEVPVYD